VNAKGIINFQLGITKSMNIIKIENEDQLNDFVGGQKHSQFLQSWQWGEFQEKVSGIVWRIGVEEGEKLIATVKIIKKSLPIGKSYFYCGRGPVFADGVLNHDSAKLIFDEIEKLAKDEMVMFLRFDPTFSVNEFFSEGQITSTLDVQPSKTLVLDLSKTEEELLKEMHQKTRYNIKLSEKKEVKIIETDINRFEEFWNLLDQTSGRDNFRPHGRSYYQKMLGLEKNFIKLFFAEYNGSPIATGVFSFFGDTVTYLHGGSSNESRELMAPHLLQWHCIKKAKELGFKYYDFHGIDEAKWPGVTRFKKGFGGEEINYPGTFDLIYDQGWYSIYKMVRKVRRSF